MSVTTPIYPAIGTITNAPACCLCGGAMVAQDDLDVCSGCGSRRVRSQNNAAAPRASVSQGPDAVTMYTWRHGPHYYEIEAFPDGRVEFFYKHCETGQLWGKDVAARCSAATPPDHAALRALFDEVLTDLQSTILECIGRWSSDPGCERDVLQDDIDDYRARFNALVGEG